MSQQQPDNPLHGVTLQRIVEELVQRHGFERLAALIPIRCFSHQPSLGSSLKFLRRTPWAREKVERLWVREERQLERKRERNRRRAARRARAAEAGEE
jgi:uncharacterized protein (DUF2132 family)